MAMPPLTAVRYNAIKAEIVNKREYTPTYVVELMDFIDHSTRPPTLLKFADGLTDYDPPGTKPRGTGPY